MSGLRERFQAKIDRSGEHHIWTGSKKADGSGKLKIQGKTITARRVAWELAHGPLEPGAVVLACPVDKACVRVDHLQLAQHSTALGTDSERRRASHGAGSKREIQPGVWKLTVNHGRYPDGTPRREYKTVRAGNEADAEREKATFVAEIHAAAPVTNRDDRNITLNEAVERYLEEHLRGELGREARTIKNYRHFHQRWGSPELGQRRLRDIDEAAMDRLFGNIRKAGKSKSLMNNLKSLYQPMFRWAKQRQMIRRNPMVDFQLGKSLYVPTKRTPPEVEQLCRYLAKALEVVPTIAPVLTTLATTGMRLGEAVAIRRDRLDPDRNEITVDTAADLDGVKRTKTDKDRPVPVDSQTMEMLLRHCDEMDKRAAEIGVAIPPDGFVFSVHPDCSVRMSPEYVSKRIADLKEHLGIANKSPDVIEREDQALRLFSQPPPPRPKGRRGPGPKGGMSYAEIGRQLGRSHHWVAKAIKSAQLREQHGVRSDLDIFDGSAIALRKFTSTELLESGFDVAAVAARQGHSPQVLLKHYAKPRDAATRKAAEHLGRLIHRLPADPDDDLGLGI